MDDAIKLAQLRLLVDARAVDAATLTGRKAGWTISVDVAGGSRTLCAADGSVRVFSSTDSAIAQMARIGLTRVHVIADDHQAGTLRAPRPDRAVALREASAYAAWLKEKVQRSIDGIDTGEDRIYSLEEVRSKIADRKRDVEARKKRSS